MLTIGPDITDAEYAPQGRPYVIRVARSPQDLDDVYRLTHHSIVHAGYMQPTHDGRIVSYPDLDASPLTTVLVALQDGEVIGTNSLTADGPLGVHTDRYFPAETEAIRREGTRLVSSFRIATQPTLRSVVSFSLILDIVRWTLVVALERYGFNTMLCTFNPKHELVYRRMLNAETVARTEQIDHGSIAAGAVLMRIEAARLPVRLMGEVIALSQGHRAQGAGMRTAERPAVSVSQRG